MVLQVISWRRERELCDRGVKYLISEDEDPCVDPYNKEHQEDWNDKMLPPPDFSSDLDQSDQDVSDIVNEQNRDPVDEMPVEVAAEHEIDGDNVVQDHDPEVVSFEIMPDVLIGAFEVVSDGQQEENADWLSGNFSPDGQEVVYFEMTAEEPGHVVRGVCHDDVVVDDDCESVVDDGVEAGLDAVESLVWSFFDSGVFDQIPTDEVFGCPFDDFEDGEGDDHAWNDEEKLCEVDGDGSPLKEIAFNGESVFGQDNDETEVDDEDEFHDLVDRAESVSPFV